MAKSIALPTDNSNGRGLGCATHEEGITETLSSLATLPAHNMPSLWIAAAKLEIGQPPAVGTTIGHCACASTVRFTYHVCIMHKYEHAVHILHRQVALLIVHVRLNLTHKVERADVGPKWQSVKGQHTS